MANQKFKWQAVVAKYAFPDTWRSWWQLINSLISFLVLWYLAYRSMEVGYWLTLLLIIPTAGFMTRLFIIFHDCCHGSFFKGVKANERLGMLIGVLVLTPFYEWRHTHAIHHATAGDLDRPRTHRDGSGLGADDCLVTVHHEERRVGCAAGAAADAPLRVDLELQRCGGGRRLGAHGPPG